MTMYFVYVFFLDSVKKKYTGPTKNLERRLFEHNNGLLGKFTKGKGPWRLIYSEEFQSREEAVRREKELKSGKGRAVIRFDLKNYGIKKPFGCRCKWHTF
jgi:putative endonuclease